MKQLLLLGIIFSLTQMSKGYAQEQVKVVLNQNTSLHSSSNLAGVNDIEYLLQPKRGEFSQKVLISPFKLGSKERVKLLRNLRINLAQEGSLTTIGFGSGFSSDLGEGRNGHVSSQLIIGANVSLFPNWGSPSRDEDQDGAIDNYYSIANQSVNIGWGRVDQLGNHFLISAVYEKKREQAVENTKEVTAIGYTVGLMGRLHSNAKTEGIFRQLKWGGVIEQSLPIDNQGALSNGNSYELSFAPQLEAQLQNNFFVRISVPFQVIEGKVDERGFGSFFQLFIVL